jgi:hypothetical protein
MTRTAGGAARPRPARSDTLADQPANQPTDDRERRR